ncbi:hypothetical protein [Belnapia rosea]|uniref:Uncharacterized protein n=1 Tax=Belnapia rosea TaxID=938405 RepID=A0A1G6W8C8_9PROT|nr:hypothetical protein [Belnapia rosea]SDB30318.1 hypothetical protein SAMN02927895_01034 [Belnapia rosea]SDD62200.1 hypothetical protein SAMN04487779_1010108 [Belnapia rosea]
MLGQAVPTLVLTTLGWFGQMGTAWLWQTLGILLAWGLLSTTLVGCAGAWIALGRARRPEGKAEAVRRGSVAG